MNDVIFILDPSIHIFFKYFPFILCFSLIVSFLPLFLRVIRNKFFWNRDPVKIRCDNLEYYHSCDNCPYNKECDIL